MNLRTAKAIKATVDNLPYVIIGLGLTGLVSSFLYTGYLKIGLAVLIIPAVPLTVVGLIWGINKLYKKAVKTIREIEEGDNHGGRPHHLDYGYEEDEY